MKVSKKSFIITEAVLGILVLILVVMMLRENNGEPLGRVSVIVRDSDNAQWAAFKYGIRMAAQDRGVEAVIVGTESVMTTEEERELIESEIGKGADAVIVQPVPGEGVEEMLQKVKKKVPVMLVEALDSGNGKASEFPVTAADDYAMGQALAREVLEDYSGNLEGKTLGIVSRTTDSEVTARRTEGFCDALEGTGAEVSWRVAGNFDNGEEDYLGGQEKVDFVAALDDSSLTAAGAYSASDGLNGALLYGIAHSTQAAYYLDTGSVECLVVPDGFHVGYQSMSEIADGMEQLFYKEKDQVVSYTVLRRETMFSKENQELLFTMSQ